MPALIMLFFFAGTAEARLCRGLERAMEFLNTNRFLQRSREVGRELMLPLADISQARSFAFRFPAFRELGFGSPNANTWRRYQGRLAASDLHGHNVGWEISNGQGHARVRLDWDEHKGGHYNIEIRRLHNGRNETHRLAVQFQCNNHPCSRQDINRLAQSMQ
jgi:hypothetical protein